MLAPAMTMRALYFDGHAARACDRPEPDPRDGRAIVRMVRAGVCNTDLEIARGYMGFRGVLGHELAGVVESGPDRWMGKRVTAEINFACGVCPSCAADLGRHCPTRTVMGILGADGAIAERVSVPIGNLHEVPDGVGFDHAAFVEPLAAAFEILDQVAIGRGTRTVVLGDGKLGLLVAQVLAQAGADVLAVGRHDAKLALLRARGIRVEAFDVWAARAKDLADVVVEATGSSKGLAAAISATRPRGTLVLKSTVAEPVTLDTAPLVIHEISVVGSRCGRFEPAIRALAEGRVDVGGMISARVPLSRADDALRLAAEKGVLKVLVENDAS
jgi:threonine dehydrogenase-like Zn-dependent dehydrogenase